MPKLTFTEKELKGYFKEKVRHHFYEESVEMSDDMKVHSDGVYPKKLIEERRPHEPEIVIDYRKKIFVPKTKPTFGKVLSSLSKIRRSSDWSIQHVKDGTRFSKIDDKETLEEYCEKKFPYFESLTNWTFQVLLKKYLEDPNACIFVFPLEIGVEENTFLRPFPVIFDSCHVLDFVPEDYAVLKNPLGSTYYVRGKAEAGDSFYVITTERIMRYDQVNSKGDMQLSEVDFAHGLGRLPVFRIGAVIAKADGHNYLYESRVAGMLPELNEAIREYSDLQAAKVIHIYPERYEFVQNQCPKCKGTTQVKNPRWHPGCDPTMISAMIDCDNPKCVDGYIAAGPYSKILIRPTNNAVEAGTNIPTPPAGYVEKDVEIVRIMEESVKQHIYDGLAAINFQFLENTPLNESGKAKEVDRDELNNTVHAIAEDIVKCLDNTYKLIALYRYGTLYSMEEIAEEMLPKIIVPEKYDLLSSSHLVEELSASKDKKLNPVLQNALEVEYAAKKFNTDSTVSDLLELVFRLDPLPNTSEDEKNSRLQNKGISQETYIISSNIHEFVQLALDENEDFPSLPLADQKKKMKELAGKLLQEQEAAAQKVRVATDNAGLGPNGEPLDEGQEQQVQQTQQPGVNNNNTTTTNNTAATAA